METDTLSFFNAIKKGDRTIVESILTTQPEMAGISDAGGLSAVLMALYYGHPEIANLLIDAGALLTLFEASAAGRLELVREILDQAPAQINSWSPDGFQPLGLACFFGHTELAAYLLENGAEINAPSHNLLNVQPINSAVAGQHLEITRLLLEHGSDANARQGEGFTPLHAAAQNGQLDMIRLLLEHGADSRVRNDAGKSPLDLALESGHIEAASLLM